MTFRFNASQIVAIAFLGATAIPVLGAPLTPGYDPYAQNLAAGLAPIGERSFDGRLYVLGTDTLGRDILSRLALAGQVTILIGAAAVAVSLTIGVALGLVAGYFRGPVEAVIMGLADLQLSIPRVLLLIAVTASDQTNLCACRIAQDVAAVAASTPEQAHAALRQMSVRYIPQPFLVDTLAATAHGAPVVHPGKVSERATEGDEPGTVGAASQRGNLRTSPSQKKGDADKGMRQAKVTHEATYTTQTHTHSALETHSIVLRWDSATALTAWCSTQGIFSVRDELAEVFGLKPQDVHVITDFMGGGFGAKFGASAPGTRLGFIAGELARQAKAPVALLLEIYHKSTKN